ncbi:uncharacterized protein [Ambystoma mexicanum]|uniref:uncharacterized protein n=1 Tax=Ambystoma mexicanum TaxID=8296 RepID=UPI0037E7608C
MDSRTWEDHLYHLYTVMRALRKAGLNANPKKCKLAKSAVKYLRFCVGNGSVQPQQEKVRAVLETPTPKTKRDLRAVLGLIGYYCRFILNFSDKTSRLMDKLKSAEPQRVKWYEEDEICYNTLK